MIARLCFRCKRGSVTDRWAEAGLKYGCGNGLCELPGSQRAALFGMHGGFIAVRCVLCRTRIFRAGLLEGIEAEPGDHLGSNACWRLRKVSCPCSAGDGVATGLPLIV